ncbi:MAG TPA: hypothetical protein VFN10_01995 [Thermoanaerobaculia bacterium]|nr:hypothetical protein [Thermoanaerobaculia bacterium]
MLARRAIPLLLLLAFSLAAIAPIRSYDFFWHLATGRWIVEHHALPQSDPFATASARGAWINGEWLFEAPLYLAYRAVGANGLSWLRGLLAGVLFTLAWWLSGRNAPLAALAFAGAMPLLDVRPSAVAALLAMLAIAAAERNKLVLFCVLTVLWINVHPSALLAPFIALVITRRITMPLASAVMLLVNPYGWRAVWAPIELTQYVRGGAIVNAEWLPSPPLLFPLLYIAVGIGVAVFVINREWRVQLARIVLFAVFAYLAIRHARNQSLFFATFPLLVAPAFRREWLTPRVAAIATAAIVALAAITGDRELGVKRAMFPLRAVNELRATQLRGNIYNPDQFGGLVIWTFYPERRALTDGRNELYRDFNAEYAKARLDERAWRALLRKYSIDLAIDEYRAPLPVVNYATKQETRMPASLAYWPRRDWALIGYDDVGMVFARRAAFEPELIAKLEKKGVVPDARD